jgi:hypothetical protein
VAVGFPALCVARPSGSGWEALCLDFDIGVQGQSFVDVQCKLEDMVTSYIEDALQEEEPHRSRLLHRRTPLGVRLLWGVRIFLATVFGRRDGERPSSIEFPIQCPA